MQPDSTGFLRIGAARRLAWEGPGWPEPDSYAAAMLDALYWGDLAPWSAEHYGGPPGDFGAMVVAGVARPGVAAYWDDRLPRAQSFASQWTMLRAVMGTTRAQRRQAWAAVRTRDVDPIILACPGVFRWCQGDGLKPPPD